MRRFATLEGYWRYRLFSDRTSSAVIIRWSIQSTLSEIYHNRYRRLSMVRSDDESILVLAGWPPQSSFWPDDSFLHWWQARASLSGSTGAIVWEDRVTIDSPVHRFRALQQQMPNHLSRSRLCADYQRLRGWYRLLPAHSKLSLIHIWRCRRYSLCRSRWSPYH